MVVTTKDVFVRHRELKMCFSESSGFSHEYYIHIYKRGEREGERESSLFCLIIIHVCKIRLNSNMELGTSFLAIILCNEISFMLRLTLCSKYEVQ